MVYLNILKTLLQNALTTKVPLWVALLLGISLAYYVTRPEPQKQTVIEYRDFWRPPIISKPLTSTSLVNYAPVPKGELRIDTIRVPVMMTNYQLWKPEEVETRQNSVVVRSYDLSTASYRDYYYRVPQSKFDANLRLHTYTSVWEFAPSVELEGNAGYNRWGLVGRVGVTQENPYITVGVSYTIR